MREFKFRAWDKENNCMVDVDFLGENVVKITNAEWESIEHFEIMQYTGLKDRTGTEIYEGDIVKQYFVFTRDEGETVSGHHRGEVVIIASQGACIKHPILNSTDNDNEYILNQYKNVAGYRSEVIGNIYENPELLELRS